VLRCALVHVGVGLELEEQVQPIYDEKDLGLLNIDCLGRWETYHASTTTNFQYHFGSFCRLLIAERSMESRLLELVIAIELGRGGVPEARDS